MISIITPVYKAEKFLVRCVDSILNQSNHDWELILVDDGSPDSSGRICDDYASKDSRIVVVHKPNGGASSARNAGLLRAKGKWVTFVDADDYLSYNYLEATEGTVSDIVVVESKRVDLEGNIRTFTQLPPAKSNDKESYKGIIQSHIRRAIMKVPWGKFIKRSCIGDLQFNIGQKIGEDALFMYDLFYQCNSIEIKNGYYYIWQEDTVPDEIKYRLEVEDAIRFTSLIYNSYLKLEIKSQDLEQFLIEYFFSLCDKSNYRNLYKWFENSLIKEIQSKAYQDGKIPLEYIMWKNLPWGMYQYFKARPVAAKWIKSFINEKKR